MTSRILDEDSRERHLLVDNDGKAIISDQSVRAIAEASTRLGLVNLKLLEALEDLVEYTGPLDSTAYSQALTAMAFAKREIE